MCNYSSLQELGVELERRRVACDMSLAAAGNLVGKSGTWIRNLEHWDEHHKPWPNLLLRYMRRLEFSSAEIILIMHQFDLFPKSDSEFEYFSQEVRRCTGGR